MDDVIEFVRQQMYMELNDCDDSSVEGSDDESDTDNITTSNNNTEENQNINNDINKNDGNSADKNSNVTSNEESDTSHDAANDTDDNLLTAKNVNVPANYIFPSFMAFVIYGPFVDKSKQLTLFLHKDAAKGATKSRSGNGTRN